jgi:sensor histidine kinase YesM
LRNKRKKVWIDRFQTRLLLRIILYFVLYQAAVWSLFALERAFLGSLAGGLGEAGAVYGTYFAVLTVFILGYLFILDAVRFTHRLVGPLVRFRESIKAVAAGKNVDLVILRKEDFLQELKDEFNEMLRALEERGAVSVNQAQRKQEERQPVAV